MTNRRKKRCKQYGCPNLHTNKNGYCDECNRKWLAKHPEYQKEKAEREKERNRVPAHKRGYDARWHKFAKAFIQKHPVCAICGQPAKVGDHKDIPADVMLDALGAFDYDESHYQPLCYRCNAKKGFTADVLVREEYSKAKAVLDDEK